MNNSLSFDSFTVPLAQMHVDEDTSELKSCNVYKKSNVQNMEEGNQECTDIKTYRILEQYPTTKNILTQYVNTILGEALGYDSKFIITTSWITLMTKNTKSQNHIHKNSFWSGVYYFDDTYGDKVGSLSLRNPIHQLSSFSPNCKELTSVTATEIYIKPKSNTLVMFPSYVYHEVALHEEDNDRHSLAFNVMPMGQYGTGDSRYDTSWGTLK